MTKMTTPYMADYSIYQPALYEAPWRPVDPGMNAGRFEVAFIDQAIEGWQSLAHGVRPGVEVVLLDTDRDGLARMAAWARVREGYDAIHVFCHGAAGQLQLGTFRLDASNIEHSVAELRALGAALEDGGDLMLYGCEVAKGEGAKFVAQLGELTGANVAAADTLVGARTSGGMWCLGYQFGAVAASAALTPKAMASHQGVLAIFQFNTGSLSVDGAALIWDEIPGQPLRIELSIDPEIVVIDDVIGGGAGGGVVTETADVRVTYTISLPGYLFDLSSIDLANFDSGGDDAYTVSTSNGSTSGLLLYDTTFDQSQFLTVDGFGSEFEAIASFTLTLEDQDASSILAVFDNLVLNNITKIGVPTLRDTESTVTVTEDTASSLHSAFQSATLKDTFSDGSANPLGLITVTLTAGAGTLTAISGGGVAVSGSSPDTLSLQGTAAAIESFLKTSGAVNYTGAPNLAGAAAATLTLTADDGDGNAAVPLGSISVDITNVNDAPTATNLSHTVPFNEGQSSVALNDIVVTDVDAGDTITAILTLSAAAAGSLSGGKVGDALASHNSMTGVWTVSGSVTNVNAALAAVAFTPSANWDQDVTITTSISDADGTGPADGTITLEVTPVDDAPTLSATGLNPVFAEGDAGVLLFGNVIASTVDTGQFFTGFTLTATNVAAGDTLEFGDTSLALDTASTGSITVPSGQAKVELSGTTATVTVSGLALSDVFEDILATLAYFHGSSPGTASRTFTLTGLTDSGETNNSTTGLNLTSTVEVMSRPRITSIDLPDNDVYRSGDSLTFNVNFDQDVTVAEMPRLALTIGDQLRYADYVSGSGTGSLVFTYVVANGDEDIDGIALAPTIDLNGGGLAAAMPDGLAAVGTLGSVGSLADVRVDAVVPVAPGLALALDSGVVDGITNNGTVNVTGLEAGASWQYSLNAGASWTAGAGSNLTFPSDGAKSVIVRQTDAVGNTSDASTALVFTLDTTTPVVTSVVVPANGTYVAGDRLVFTVNFSEDVLASGTPRLALVIGEETVYADYDAAASASANQLVFSYEVQAGDVDANGIDLQSLSLNGGSIADGAGNAALLPLTNAALTTGVTVDAQAPFLVSMTPADNSILVPVGTNITLLFNEAVQVSDAAGWITLYEVDAQGGFQQVDTFDLSTAISGVPADGQVQVAGISVVLNPSEALLPGRQYAVKVDAGALKDQHGNVFAGIDDLTTLNFETLDPTVLYTSGAGFDTVAIDLNDDGIADNANKILNHLVADEADNTIVIVDPTYLTGSTLDGLGGTDTVRLEGGAGTSFDFTKLAKMANVETLVVAGDPLAPVTVSLGTSYGLGPGGLNTLTGTGDDVLQLVGATGQSSFDLSGTTLTGFSTLDLDVFAGVQTLQLNQSQITGGTGRITTIKGGAGADTLQIEGVAGDLDLSASGLALSSIDTLELTGSGSVKIDQAFNVLVDKGSVIVLETAAASLDLSGKSLLNVGSLTSTNTTGTAFVGSDSNDTIIGGIGADTLNGGLGNDELTGGAGDDVFLFLGNAVDNGIDLITDFRVNDRIRVTDAGFASGAVSEGNGDAVGPNQIQVAVANGITTLYIGTDIATGAADLVIRLTGEFLPGSFIVQGTDIWLAGNMAPVITAGATATVDENASDASLGAITIADADGDAQEVTLAATGGTFSLDVGQLAIVTGANDSASITLKGDLSAINTALTTLVFTPTPNLTGTGKASLAVLTDDGQGDDDIHTIVIDITDVKPEVAAQTFAVAENSASGTAVGVVLATKDTNGLTWSVTGGTGAGLFVLDTATGAITVAQGAVLDYESVTSYTLEIAVNDENVDPLAPAATQTITINITDVNDTPVIPPVNPPVTPPVVPTTPVDGVPVQITTGPDGQQQIVVPVVTPGRNEDTSTPNSRLADIAVVENAAGVALLNVGLPVGTGLTTNGPTSTISATNAQSVLDGRINSAAGTAEQKASAQAFLASLPADTQVVVQTVTVTAQAADGGPLVVSAVNLGDGHRTAVVIDTRSLPAGTLIDLENVDFAVIVGDARVMGGAGANVAYGDDDDQFIVLGEGDDVLHGQGGNDTVGSLRGNDRVFGDAGDDIVYGGSGDDTLTGGTGNDAMNGGFGFDTGVQSGARGDYTVRTENGSVILTHRTSGEIDRFTDVERITFDSGRAIVVAHEASDVADLRARFGADELIELNLTRAIGGTDDRDVITPELGVGRHIDLGAGQDVVKLAGGRDDVHLDVEAGQIVHLTRLEDGAMLSFQNTELLEFANGDVTVLAQNTDQAIVGRVYELLLGRNVDVAGFQFWADALNAGISLQSVLQLMVTSQEAADMYKLTNGNFIEQLYVQGLDRTSDAAGKTYWADALASGVSRAVVLEGFAGSAEAVDVIGSTVDVNVMT